ncbi:aminotransferase [Candidatus Fermentibacteria bacterium]|nr:MAG: aminotransferase [Candidatus Fermentibacteria bacterium]
MSVHKGLPEGSALSENWCLDRDIVFLNHGSFGACPAEALVYREKLLRSAEKNPMEFLLEHHQPLLEKTIMELETFTGAQSGSVVMVENATTAVNTILENMDIDSSDTVLVTDQEYFSSANALETLAEHRGFNVKVVEMPWPVKSEKQILERFQSAIDSSVRYALVDHVISSTGMVMPLESIITLLKQHGIETMVDGAHGPGQLPLALEEMGCVAYAGNCHKWLCSPRSSAMLYVRPDFQRNFKPLVISHLPRRIASDLSDYQIMFRWNGTPDPTPELTIPFTMKLMASMDENGWSGVMERNRNLAIKASEMICSSLGVEHPYPSAMVGSMAAVPLPGYSPDLSSEFNWIDPLQRKLREEFGIVVPVTSTGFGSDRLVRLSAQLYNSFSQYEWLADALKKTLVS